MARAMKCTVDRSGWIFASAKRPSTARRAPLARCRASTPSSRPVSSERFADRGEREARGHSPGPAWRRVRISFFSRVGMQLAQPPTSPGRAASMRPPGNTNLPGMNLWPAWRRPSRTFGSDARAVDQHQGRGIARLAVGKRLVALRSGHAVGQVPCRDADVSRVIVISVFCRAGDSALCAGAGAAHRALGGCDAAPCRACPPTEARSAARRQAVPPRPA